MKERGRVQNSILNMISGFGYRIFIMLTAFVVRTVFIHCLDEVYLGVNGLYSNILTMLSLAELGFGTAMVYSMYRPLAEKDYNKIRQLMKLYKKVYSIIGTVVLVIGLALVPFLPVLIKDQPDIDGLTFYYILFLLNSVFSYWFFAYRNSLLQADQKAYVISNNSTLFNLIRSVLQIILLLVFHSFTIYLVTQILCTIAQNIVLAYKVKKEYPVFDKGEDDELPKKEKNKIFRDVKALMLSKVSFVVLNGTDNIIISAFVGLKWVGLLSNFVMIIDAVTGIITQITGAIQASLGNFFVKESKGEGYILFKRVDFLNYWMYGFSAIALFTLLNPFVTIWLGENFTLSFGIVAALASNFFVAGLMNTLWTFRSTLGLFTQGLYRPIIVAALNVVLSIALSYPWGAAGVLAATSISRLCVNLWYDPMVLHKYGFNMPVWPYYFRYIRRIILLFGIAFIMQQISNRIFADGVGYVNFAVMVVLTAIIPNLIFLLIYFRTDEFKYYVTLAKKIILRR